MLSVRSWLLVAAIVVAGAAHGQAPKPAGEMGKYTSKEWRWSIAYPAGWTVESPEPDLVRIRSSAQGGLCSIVSGAVDRFNTVDELTDFMLDHDERYLKEKGHKFTVLARKRINLPNGIVGNDVLAEIGPGGRSRRINVLVDGRGLVVDCEAHAKDWSRLDAAYQRIIASFTVNK
jgi:hypothetical protein